MDTFFIIIALGLLIFFSHLFNELFDRTKIPNVLLLLLIGIIIGPVSGIITQDFFGSLGQVFTTITLIIILFESGASLKLGIIRKTLASSLLLTVLNFIITVTIAVAVVSTLTPLNIVEASFVGAIIGGTSSAVVIPMVRQLKLSDKGSSLLILESALSDVLCLVVGLALLDGIAEGMVSMGKILSNMWKGFLFALLIGLLAGVIWSFFIRSMRSLKNSMFTTLAFTFVLYGIVESLSFNGGISVLAFGIVLGNIDGLSDRPLFRKLELKPVSGVNENERNFFSEIVFVMQTYFFVYVGISLQFGSLKIYAIGLMLILLIMASRPFIIKLFTRKDYSASEVAIMSVMTPKGLVPAILASIPLQMGFTGGEVIMDLGYSVVLFSIILCSALVIFIGKKKEMKVELGDIITEMESIAGDNPDELSPGGD
ncbi:MAG: cation:proton antiporter [Bacteroidales bacterium]|nr:cation:proton antiporter [Bacteroidales bacterium]